MSEDPNAALRQTLHTYVSGSRDPGYAILLTGSWGIGKTFLINQFMDNGIGDTKPFYVSLYGISSKDDFDNAVFAALYPYTDNKATKIGTSIGSSILGKFGFSTKLKISDVINTVKAGVFIFDDLERLGNGLDAQTVMGYLNKYIEHAGCRVVLICNEDEIKDRDTFMETKEKLIGRTIRVKPETSQALRCFLTTIGNKACKTYLIEHSASFKNLYERSKVNNLRILKQALWDIEQLHIGLDPQHLKNTSVVDELLKMFFVFALEAKKGRLKPDDLLNRPHGLTVAARRNNNNADKTRIETLNEKYAEIYVYDSVLSNKVLKATIFDGDFSAEAITASLENDHRFATLEKEPEWKTVWNGAVRDDKALESAAREMEVKYAAQEYLVPGIFLHVFTQRLWLSSLEFIKGTEADIIASAKSYIDDLLAKGLLEPHDTHLDFNLEFSSFDGLGYSKREEQPFVDITTYLTKKRIEAFQLTIQDAIPDLMAMMTAETGKFVLSLLPYNGSESKFGHHPILAEIDANEFVKAILTLTANQQHDVFMLLSNRYKHNMLEKELAPEKEWLVKLRDILLNVIKNKSVFTQDRIERFIKWYVDPALEEEPKNTEE